MLHSSPPAINADQSLTPTQPNMAHPLSESVARRSVHPKQGFGKFGPNTFEGAGTHVWLHPHELDAASRASRPATVSTALLQTQKSSNQQTDSYQHGQSLQYQLHMAHRVTYDQGDQGLLLPGIECGVADLMLQALIRWHANIQCQAMLNHSPHLRLSRGRNTCYRLCHYPPSLEDPRALIRLSKMTLLGKCSVMTASCGTPTPWNPADPMVNQFSWTSPYGETIKSTVASQCKTGTATTRTLRESICCITCARTIWASSLSCVVGAVTLQLGTWFDVFGKL